MSSDSETPTGAPDGNELVSRLRVIEDQPLETRAEAFGAVHRELQTALESSDTAR